MRFALLPTALAFLAACSSPFSSPAPAASGAAAEEPAASAVEAPPAPASVPPKKAEPILAKVSADASIRLHWFAYGSSSAGAHKLWMATSTKTRKATLSYIPDTGEAPPDKDVLPVARDAVVHAVEALKLDPSKPPPAEKPGASPRYSYTLLVTWPRDGKQPASYVTTWTDTSETPELAAVRKAMLDLGRAKFPAVEKAAPPP
jgi:hypothetical protein